jgi:hypothetical protein
LIGDGVADFSYNDACRAWGALAVNFFTTFIWSWIVGGNKEQALVQSVFQSPRNFDVSHLGNFFPHLIVFIITPRGTRGVTGHFHHEHLTGFNPIRPITSWLKVTITRRR